jgi:hypothetical protein
MVIKDICVLLAYKQDTDIFDTLYCRRHVNREQVRARVAST